MALVDKKAPELRLKGFTEDWELCKFEDLLDKENGIRRGPFGSALKKEFFVKNSDFVVYEQQNAIYDHYETRYKITEEKYNELKAFNLTENDFIMSGAGTIGRISKVPKGIKPGVFNQALIRFRIECKRTDSEYFIQFMRSEGMQKKLTGANPGSAITNLVPMSEVKKWEIVVPQIEEQVRVGKFLKKLDNTITLHQRKLVQLKTLKQAYLQQLFPSDGEYVPKVRFANFNQDWELCKVATMAKKTYGGGTPKTSVKEYWQGDLPWIQSSDLIVDNLKHVMPTKFITQEAISKSATKAIPKNSIAIVTRVGVGKLALIPYSYATSQDFLSLSLLNVDSYFGVYSLYKLLQNEINYIQGTSIKGITKGDLLEKSIKIPMDTVEQTGIGIFFNQLDEAITLHQHKLESLNKLKQAYLQKMFI